MSTPVAAPAAAAPTSAPASSPSTSSTPSSTGTQGSAAPVNKSPADIAAGNTAPKGTAETKADASATQQAAVAKAEEIRKWKLKGKTGEVELTEAELLRRAQLGLGADEKFSEAAEMRKSAEALFEALKRDPMAVLNHPALGINAREVIENYLSKELQAEMLPPEQRELQDLRAFKKAQEDAKAEAEKADMTRAQQTEFNQHMQRAAKEYDTKITDVLQSSNLPKTPYTVKRVAELLRGALAKGYDLDVNTAVDMVREGYMGDFKSLFGGLKGESLVKFLGDDVLKEMRQYDLARIRAKLEAQQTQSEPSQTPIAAPRQNQSEPKQMRPDEWKDFLRKKAGV